ncbi:MAG TPA: alkaline phosphatase family protein [Candidatus Acidoferrales bacterium]|nr:alkaline phosphatase family protein [Candidatus Acidoferrales bacterium]
MPCLAAVAFAACSAAPVQPSTVLPMAAPVPMLSFAPAGFPSRGKIKHIVIIVQENRTFENIFAGFPNADAPMFGYLHDGTKVPLEPLSLNNSLNLAHGIGAAKIDWNNGAMNGFDTAAVLTGYPPRTAYRYLSRLSVKPYWTLARQYTLADKMFETEWGGSFTAHLDLIAGTTKLSPNLAEADYPSAVPWSCDAPAGTTTTVVDPTYLETIGPFPCFVQFRTMADTLDDGKISWKYYAPSIGSIGGSIWSEFGAIKNVRYGKDWHKIVSPETKVLTDAAAHRLPAVSWVVPDLANSDHPGNSATGPSWVASVVDAIGESKAWDSTAIFVIWDDGGGWYDNAPPPQVDFTGLGMRVPCIVISPYSKHGYVSHTQYEFGSILKFVEETFDLQSLGSTDRRATSMADSFDFTQPPQPFTQIRVPVTPQYFLTRRPSLLPPDEE